MANIQDWIENSGDLTGLAKDLAQFMKEEGLSEKLGNYPITQDNFGDSNSLFQQINELIDLDSQDENYLEYIENILSNQSPGTINDWNESVTKALQTFKNKLNDNKDGKITVHEMDSEGKAVGQGVIFSILSHVLKANAGWSFAHESWVQPDINIDGESYKEVRDGDEIEDVLNSQKNMQFTHTQTDGTDDEDNKVTKYIRLLMPKYTRRVEVEDLNRNFWVIGQVLTALSAYLFDEDSPLKLMLKQILNEIVQLWENLIYIWAAINQGKDKYVDYTQDNIQYIVTYVPNSNLNHEFKFDGYDIVNIENLDQCGERLKFLINQYSNKHLCVLPIVRKNNYFKNYYSQEVYYGILFYDRNSDSNNWTQTIRFKNENGENGIVIQKEDEDKLFYIKENNGIYDYIDPGSSIPQNEGWISAIRTYVSSFECALENQKISEVTKLIVQIYDAGLYSLDGQGIDHVNAIELHNESPTNDNIQIEQRRYIIQGGVPTVHGYRGMYLCELVTDMNLDGGDTPVDYNGSANLLKIGNYSPALKTTAGTETKVVYKNENTIPALGLGLMTNPSDNKLTDTINGYTVYITATDPSDPVDKPVNKDFYYYDLTGTSYDFDANLEMRFYWVNKTSPIASQDFGFYDDFKRKILNDSSKQMSFKTFYGSYLNETDVGENITYKNLADNGFNYIKTCFEAIYTSSMSESNEVYCIGLNYGTSPWIGGRGSDQKETILDKINYTGTDDTYNGRLYWADTFVTHLFRVVFGQANLSKIVNPIENNKIMSNNNWVGYIENAIPLNLIDSAGGVKAPNGMTNFFRQDTSGGNWRIMNIKYPKNYTYDNLKIVVQFIDGNETGTFKKKPILSYELYKDNNNKMVINYNSSNTFGYKITSASNRTRVTGDVNLPDVLMSVPNQNSNIWFKN